MNASRMRKVVVASAASAVVVAAMVAPARSQSSDAGAAIDAGSALDAGATRPKLQGASVPTTPTPAPSEAEWKDAVRVDPTRDVNGVCSFSVLRDWLKIECAQRHGASMLAGDATDVKITASGDPFEEAGDFTSNKKGPVPFATIVTRLARGSAKMFVTIKAGWTYESIWSEDGERIAVTWREGKADPVILVEALR